MLPMIKSYWNVFRIIFVMFSLYLMGDAFYRWDGFKHYASSYDFIASLSLASLIWNIIAVVTALTMWLIFWLSVRISERMNLKITMNQLLIFLFFSLLLGVGVWKLKILIWPNIQSTIKFKLLILMLVVLAAALFSWLMRNKTGKWIDMLQERITPLVWLFGILIIIAALLVTNHLLFLNSSKEDLKKVASAVEDNAKRPNVLLVTFDALSAKNMSVYGYHRPTTPFISKWSEGATVFTNAHAASNYTAPATATLVTGKDVWTHFRYNRMQGSRPFKSDTESLPLVLKKYGYYNMVFIANPIASAENLGITNSIDIAPIAMKFWNTTKLQGKFSNLLLSWFGDRFKIYNWLMEEDFILGKLVRKYEGDELFTRYPPELAFNSLLSNIGNSSQNPFFVWIHLDPPHYPYLAPEPFRGIFDKSGKLNTLKSQSRGKTAIEEYVRQHGHFPEDINILRARYDEFIRYCDKQFEDFIGKLEAGNLLENTVVILSSDHGEIFEHNSMLHGTTLFEPETNIPLIIKEAAQLKGKLIQDVVGQKDIPATIIDFASIEVPSWMEGQSLLPLMHGGVFQPRPVFSMNLENSYSPPAPIINGTIAVWDNNFKLIYSLETNTSMLFNLKEDPDEKNNLVDIKPDTSTHLLKLIRESLDNANEKISKME